MNILKIKEYTDNLFVYSFFLKFLKLFKVFGIIHLIWYNKIKGGTNMYAHVIIDNPSSQVDTNEKKEKKFFSL